MEDPRLICVDWDEDAAEWTADSQDIPGMETNSEMLKGLPAKLESMGSRAARSEGGEIR